MKSTTGRIRIGNQTAYSASSPSEPFGYAVSNGFDAFEWFPDKKDTGAGWTVDDITAAQRDEFRRTAEAHDITFTFHLSFAADPSAGRHDLLLREIAFARQIGAALINLHLHAPRGIPAFADELLPVWKEISAAGMSLSIENTVETGPEQFNELFRLLRRRLPGSSGVGLCLDIGHANLCSATRNDYLGFVDRLDPAIPILHVHLHENYGDGDTHLTLFTGPSGADPSGIMGLAGRLRQRSFAGCMILEQWPHSPRLLNNARARLLDIMGMGTPPAAPITNLDPLARRIVEADRRNRSWRSKLGWVHEVLAEKDPDTNLLAYLAVYLKFVGTGQLTCTEDGGHYRPSNHARMSHRIYNRLGRITTPENDLVIRKIYPWLPSFDGPFLHAEPLTRIRDIAHRNDIPGELKQEIKTTLQNKLHRSAGPEDLVTSAAILRRITAAGAGYSPSFVEEFERFHRELQEFFNAGSLEDKLSGLAAEGLLEASAVDRFMRAKAGATPREHSEALRVLVELRTTLQGQLQGADDQVSQRLRAADISLEDFSFSLLSILNSALQPEDSEWPQLLRVLGLAVVNVRLSGLPADECRAIESELAALAEGFGVRDRLKLLRVRATVERCRRLADDYCEKILGLFPGRAEQLGGALGVPRHAIRVYAESDIRAHPVFQVSRLTDTLGGAIRRLAGLPPWDVIVPGAANGRLYDAPSMGRLPALNDSAFVLMVDELTGEEEIPPGLVALITMKNIPHLSHLAVRARQRRLVFAVCEDSAQYLSLKRLQGHTVFVDARSDGVQIGTGEQVLPGSRDLKKARVTPPSIEMHNSVLAIDEVTLANSGPKAFSLRKLGELAPLADFEVPGAIVLPFGLMEDAMEKSGMLLRYNDAITTAANSELSSLDARLTEIYRIIVGLELPAGIIKTAGRTFGHNSRLMVRSSASTEDSEGSMEAGLFRSVANVPLTALAPAVREVWSSLWSRRAVISRRHSGMSGLSVRMAVILQEMVVPRYSFIMHTAHPLTQNDDDVYLEIAVGLGEVLASGAAPGTPYRAACNPNTGEVEILAFSSLSEGLWPGNQAGETEPRIIDYSAEELSVRPEELRKLALRIARIGKAVESHEGSPQDIEGCLADGRVFLVQTRPQAGY